MEMRKQLFGQRSVHAAESLYALARAFIRQADIAKAIAALEQSLAICPANSADSPSSFFVAALPSF
jgi:hypothetical protein